MRTALRHGCLALVAAFALSLNHATPAYAAIEPIPSPLPGLNLKKAKPRKHRQAIPQEMNPQIRQWVEYFAVEDHDRFDRFMSKGAYYKTLIENILVEHGVPAEMYYLALIESGFSTRARSWVSAVGVWQFMRGTAREYGLQSNRYVDERIDLIRSTHAAARYLKDLKQNLGSWYLAMAAYNAGEGRIRGAIRRGRTRNYWKLVSKGVLPEETAQYVPKFQAAMYVVKHAERFGFEAKTFYDYPAVKQIKVPPSTSLETIARRTGHPIDAIRALNPHLLAEQTPPKRGYRVYVPRAKQPKPRPTNEG